MAFLSERVTYYMKIAISNFKFLILVRGVGHGRVGADIPVTQAVSSSLD